MGAFDNLGSYLERVSPVMDLDAPIMTLHGAKGLAFPLVFLPGWEEGVLASQRSMDENGDKGLEAASFLRRRHPRPRGGADFVCGQPAGLRPLDQPPAQPAFVDNLLIASVEAASETGYYGGGPGMLTPPHAGTRSTMGQATTVPAGSAPRQGGMRGDRPAERR
jgi:DNA helicase-2/ATP-dependent DNA helicase PcrA